MPGERGTLRVQLLGQARAWDGERELTLGPPQRCLVLAVLALSANTTVARDSLIDALWEAAPEAAGSTLLSHISRLRSVLEPGRGARERGGTLATSSAGYLLRAVPDQIDALAFTTQVAAARKLASQPAAAVALLETAIGRWQGPPLAGLPGRWADRERQRLTEARLAALETRAELKLALGAHAELIPELTALAAEHPLREELTRLLMLALYRCGRQADALAVYRDTRRVLDTELGIEPGQALRQTHDRILTGHAAPAVIPAPPTAKPAGPATPALLPGWPLPRELPPDVAKFTGRETELAELGLLLADTGGPASSAAPRPGAPRAGAPRLTAPPPTAVPIAVVSGTAGVGKTALVIRWGHQVAAAFSDGQLYINLRGYDPGHPVTATEALAHFLRSLGVAEADLPPGEAARAARFRSLAAGKRLLVVLDNAASEEQVRPLLPGAPPAMAVVTSRHALAGLVARDGAHRVALSRLTEPEAAALLRELLGPRVEAEPGAAHTLADQCAGLPLALRVAAERVAARPASPLATLAAELAAQRGGLDLLDAGGDPRGAVASVFSWSYRQLDPAAARMFRLLGLHPGATFDTHAAAALACVADSEAARLLSWLARVHLTETAPGDRYTLHDLLRAYAAGLTARDESEAARRAALTGLFDYYLASSAAAMDAISPSDGPHPREPAADGAGRTFGDRAAALAWIDDELPALTVVAERAAAGGWPRHAIGLASVLSFYLGGGHYQAGHAIHTSALAAAEECGDPVAQATALTRLGAVHTRQGNLERAAQCHQRAHALAREAGDPLIQGRALGNLGVTHLYQARFAAAAREFAEALALYTELGDKGRQAMALSNLGTVSAWQGRYQAAVGYHEEELLLARDHGNRFSEASALINLGELAGRLGRYGDAATLLGQAVAVTGELGARSMGACALSHLGTLRQRQGRLAEARAAHAEALAMVREEGHREGEIDVLNAAGATSLAAGEPSAAHASFDSALALARQGGLRREEARALRGLADVARTEGRPAEAAGFATAALALYTEIGDQGGEAEARNTRGEILLATGEPGEARASHQAALTLASETGDPYERARAHLGLAACLPGAGEAASEHARQARRILRDLGIPAGLTVDAPPDSDGVAATSALASP